MVDVCALDAKAHSHAVAAVARDGTLIFFPDILHRTAPKTIKFRSVRGTVYRILSARGDIFMLTSKGLFLLANLAERLAQGGWTGSVTTNILPLPIAAADANPGAAEPWEEVLARLSRKP